jgi:hypothetical protein
MAMAVVFINAHSMEVTIINKKKNNNIGRMV